MADIINTLRNRSGINMDAQSPKLCEVQELSGRPKWLARVEEYLGEGYTGIDGVVVDVLLSSGCRISEALGLRGSDIIDDRTIFLRGLKGSNDRVVTLLYGSDLGALKRLACSILESGRNRFYFYRLLKNLGVYERIGKGKNAKVAHSFRYNKIRGLSDSNVPTRVIQQVIGHKRIESTEYYEQKTK